MFCKSLVLVAVLFISVLNPTFGAGDTTFYNKGWKVIPTRDGAQYFRTGKNANGKYAVADYFINGNIQMKGTFKYKDSIRNGKFTYYHENTSKSSEGTYANDKREGEWKTYRDDLQPILWTVAHYKQDKFDGSFKSYYKSGKLKRDAVYKNGELLTGKQFSEAGGSIPYTEFTIMPKAPFDISMYLSENIVYPEECREIEVTGRVLLKFYIDTDGSVKNITVINKVHPLIDEEAIRVVAAMPKWEPAMEDDKVVRIYYTLPIKFSLK
jgi:protein TonB